MNELTHDQADELRALRPKVRPIHDALFNLANQLAGACEHRDESFTDTCPVCALYVMARDADNAFRDVPDALDKFLSDGPHPQERTRDKKGEAG